LGLEAVASVLKPAFDVIVQSFSLARESRNRETTFWANEILEPLHGAMKDVHKIYIDAFKAADQMIGDGESDVSAAVVFLSDKREETGFIRKQLYAFMNSITDEMDNDEMPKPLSVFITTCALYFGQYEMGMVKNMDTPFRSLLNMIRDLDKGYTINRKQMEDVCSALQRDVRAEAKSSITGMRNYLEDRWFYIESAYHSARLHLMRPS